MAVFIQLDRSRRMKFGFNTLKHCKDVLGIAKPEELAEALTNSGDVTMIVDILEGCCIDDFDGLDSAKFTELLEEYIGEHGFDALADLMGKIMEDSAFFKAGKIAGKKPKAKKGKRKK